MFGGRFFGKRFFGNAYFGEGAASPDIDYGKIDYYVAKLRNMIYSAKARTTIYKAQ